MDSRAKIRAFITTNFYVADTASLSDDASLLENGIVDSTGVLEIISFLEREFGVEVADNEIVPANLDSIGKLTSFVAKKKT